MLGSKNHWMRHTRLWNVDRPVSKQVMWEVPPKWQHEHPIFVADGRSWNWLLLPIILRSEVHVVDESPVASFSGQEVLCPCYL